LACGPGEEKLAGDFGEALRAGEERGEGRKEELAGGDSQSAGEREGGAIGLGCAEGLRELGLGAAHAGKGGGREELGRAG
jgi:hypothetical protein